MASHNTGVPRWFHTTQVYLNTVEPLTKEPPPLLHLSISMITFFFLFFFNTLWAFPPISGIGAAEQDPIYKEKITSVLKAGVCENIIKLDYYYLALFSASEQTHCTL